MVRFLLFSLVLCASVQAEMLTDPVTWQKKVRGRGSETVVYKNTSTVPVTLRLTATTQNMKCSHRLPYLIVLAPGEKSENIHFTIKDRGRAWEYQFKYLYQFGDYRVRSPRVAFPLPFRGSAECIQAFQGDFSHQGSQGYALDFDLPEGTPILASRDGLVVRLEEGFNRAGTTKDFLKKGNYVWLAHKDGTLSRYYHLRRNGVPVELGDKVKAGQVVGYSGNTGFSAGPHLHFDVSVPGRDAKLMTHTIPFKVRHKSSTVEAQEDVRYQGGFR